MGYDMLHDVFVDISSASDASRHKSSFQHFKVDAMNVFGQARAGSQMTL